MRALNASKFFFMDGKRVADGNSSIKTGYKTETRVENGIV